MDEFAAKCGSGDDGIVHVDGCGVGPAVAGRCGPVAGWQAGRVLSVDLETVRLFLHVLAATVWVGGQITLGALVPALRGAGGDATKVAARAFNRIAWPAFGVLLVTGVWNVLAVEGDDAAYDRTLMLKYTLVLVSGVTAFLHTRARSRGAMAAFGALTGLSAVATLFVGVWLAA
jgi:putative copper export protein